MAELHDLRKVQNQIRSTKTSVISLIQSLRRNGIISEGDKDDIALNLVVAKLLRMSATLDGQIALDWPTKNNPEP